MNPLPFGFFAKPASGDVPQAFLSATFPDAKARYQPLASSHPRHSALCRHLPDAGLAKGYSRLAIRRVSSEMSQPMAATPATIRAVSLALMTTG